MICCLRCPHGKKSSGIRFGNLYTMRCSRFCVRFEKYVFNQFIMGSAKCGEVPSCWKYEGVPLAKTGRTILLFNDSNRCFIKEGTNKVFVHHSKPYKEYRPWFLLLLQSTLFIGNTVQYKTSLIRKGSYGSATWHDVSYFGTLFWNNSDGNHGVRCPETRLIKSKRSSVRSK